MRQVRQACPQDIPRAVTEMCVRPGLGNDKGIPGRGLDQRDAPGELGRDCSEIYGSGNVARRRWNVKQRGG